MMIKELNTEEFINEVVKSGQPSIIVFGIDSCNICTLAKLKILPKWQADHPKFKFYFVNVTNNPEAAKLVEIKPPNVPQMVIMIGPKVFAEFPGLPSEDSFLEMLSSVESKDKTIPSLFKRIVTLSDSFLKIIQARKIYVPFAVKQIRMKKCKECFYLTKDNICGNTEDDLRGCGCFVEPKTSLKTEKCPRGFWDEEP